ncbi:glycosyltransferase [Niveispirillum sp. SYP-B3756]|uniref:glycosyltransferase family 2 protein n=1 Tax=Niveispirillum sp. SYP-B3756 TaxID=2662178 RepID=UPI001290E3AB|nr:glycosyltransferase family 2 protein [Niveispirillum sp. SYP-B3756]MQP64024.1 glycosyltransferase [Niveispirillum sp. SYP-B3756]
MPAAHPIPVSVVVMTRNEATNIADCLSCLDAFAQVLVVDSHSSDDTASIAEGMGADIVLFRWNGRYPKKKQWSLEWPGLAHDWVLFVDADERLPPALVAEIAALMTQPRPEAAFFIDSRPVWLGRMLRYGSPYRKMALLHRRRSHFPVCDDLQVSAMWEVEGHYQPEIDGPVGHLRTAMIHADEKPPFAWFDRHNRYSDWEAALDMAGTAEYCRLAGERGWRRLAKRLVAYLPGRPLWAFLHSYVLYLGFLDGPPGLHHAAARAFYYWSISLKRDWLRARRTALPPACPPATQASLLDSFVSPANALTSSKVRRRTISSGMR